MKRIFKGGTVVTGSGLKQVDLLVKGEKILAEGEDLNYKDAEIVDVSGKYLFPGFIDAHTHMALEVSGTITADKFERNDLYHRFCHTGKRRDSEAGAGALAYQIRRKVVL